MMSRAEPVRRLALLSLGVALGMFSSSEAHSDQGFRIQPGPGLPFGEDQLRRLVEPRLAAGQAPACATVAVTAAAEPGALVVSCPDRRAEVWIGDRTGEDAARVVAVVLADLLAARKEAPAPRAPAVAASPTAVTTAAQPAPTPARQRWAIWAAPGVAWGTSTGMAFEPHLGAGWALSPRVGLLLDAGFSRVSDRSPKLEIEATVDMVPVRAGAAVTLGPAALQAGAVLRGYRARAATSSDGVRPGAFIAGTWTLVRWWPVHPYVTAGLDVYAEKLEVRVDELVTLTAGTLTPWLAVGAQWSGASP
jgi:hypothetical protein